MDLLCWIDLLLKIFIGFWALLQGNEILDHFEWLFASLLALTAKPVQLLILLVYFILYLLSLVDDLLLKFSDLISKFSFFLRRFHLRLLFREG
jgi:hypothetical protein